MEQAQSLGTASLAESPHTGSLDLVGPRAGLSSQPQGRWHTLLPEMRVERARQPEDPVSVLPPWPSPNLVLLGIKPSSMETRDL